MDNIPNPKYTTIQITRETRDLLANSGTMNDNYDTVIRKLILKASGVAVKK